MCCAESGRQASRDGEVGLSVGVKHSSGAEAGPQAEHLLTEVRLCVRAVQAFDEWVLF